jgi:hypothetical protein
MTCYLLPQKVSQTHQRPKIHGRWWQIFQGRMYHKWAQLQDLYLSVQ